MRRTKFIVVFFLLCASLISAQNKKKEEARKYFATQIEVLDNIQKLDAVEKQKLDSIFWAKWEGHKKNNIAFHEAMCGTLTKKKYFNQYFKDELEQRAWVILNDDLAYFRQEQKLSKKSIDGIMPILQQRSKETAYCEYRFFTNSNKRRTEIAKVRDKYREQISLITLKNNSKGASYNLGLVLENKEKLNLTEAQVDSIVAGVQYVKAMQKSGEITKEKNNRWEYERKYIMHNLNENQVSDFLAIRNYDYALGYAQRSWSDMQKYDIAFEYDSAGVANEIINYQLNKRKIQYVYKDEPDKLKEMDDYLYKHSFPKALRQLRVEKRKQNNQEATEKDGLTF